jgi:hypothetical protein
MRKPSDHLQKKALVSKCSEFLAKGVDLLYGPDTFWIVLNILQTVRAYVVDFGRHMDMPEANQS